MSVSFIDPTWHTWKFTASSGTAFAEPCCGPGLGLSALYTGSRFWSLGLDRWEGFYSPHCVHTASYFPQPQSIHLKKKIKQKLDQLILQIPLKSKLFFLISKIVFIYLFKRESERGRAHKQG